MSSELQHNKHSDDMFDELYTSYESAVFGYFDAFAAELRSPFVRLLRGVDASLMRLTADPKLQDSEEFLQHYVVVLKEIERALRDVSQPALRNSIELTEQLHQRLTTALRKYPEELSLPCTSAQYQAKIGGVVPSVFRVLGGVGFAIRSLFDKTEDPDDTTLQRSFSTQLPFDVSIYGKLIESLAVYAADVIRQYAESLVNIADECTSLKTVDAVSQVRSRVQETIASFMQSPSKGRELLRVVLRANKEQCHLAWKAAGTLALGPRVYAQILVKIRTSRALSKYARAQKRVHKIHQTVVGTWRYRIGLHAVQVAVQVEKSKQSHWLTAAFDKQVASSLNQFRRFLAELKESVANSTSRVQPQVLKTRASEHTVRLVGTINSLSPDKRIQEFADAARDEIGKLPERVRVFKNTKEKGALQSTEYPLRTLFVLETATALDPLSRLSDLWTAERGVSITEITDIPGVLEFLMDLRGDEGDFEESVQQSVSDGLARVDLLLDGIEKRLAFGTFLSALRTSTTQIEALTGRYAQVDTLRQAYIRKLLLDARGLFKLLLTWGYKALRLGLEKGVQLLRRLPTLFSSRYSQVKKLAGLQEQSAQSIPAIIQFRRAIEQHLGTLPEMYRKLFSDVNEDDTRFYVSDEAALAAIKESVAVSRQGYLGNCAVVGAPGSGRSSLVWSFVEQESSDQMYRLELQPGATEASVCQQLCELMGIQSCSTFDELADVLLQLEEVPICILENIHVLYARLPQRRAVMMNFMHLLSSTAGSVVWIVSCISEMWQYLDRTMNFASLFYKEVRTDQRTSEFVRKTIERRHRVSGFKLHMVEKAASSAWWTLSKSLTPEQRSDLFYDELYNASNGNIGIAHLLWLRSVTSGSPDELRVELAGLPKASLISSLSLSDKFVLHLVLQHEFVHATMVSDIMRMSASKASDSLARLSRCGLLTVSTIDDIQWFAMSRHFYGVVRNVLKAANMVH